MLKVLLENFKFFDKKCAISSSSSWLQMAPRTLCVRGTTDMVFWGPGDYEGQGQTICKAKNSFSVLFLLVRIKDKTELTTVWCIVILLFWPASPSKNRRRGESSRWNVSRALFLYDFMKTYYLDEKKKYEESRNVLWQHKKCFTQEKSLSSCPINSIQSLPKRYRKQMNTDFIVFSKLNFLPQWLSKMYFLWCLHHSFMIQVGIFFILVYVLQCLSWEFDFPFTEKIYHWQWSMFPTLCSHRLLKVMSQQCLSFHEHTDLEVKLKYCDRL